MASVASPHTTCTGQRTSGSRRHASVRGPQRVHLGLVVRAGTRSVDAAAASCHVAEAAFDVGAQRVAVEDVERRSRRERGERRVARVPRVAPAPRAATSGSSSPRRAGSPGMTIGS